MMRQFLLIIIFISISTIVSGQAENWDQLLRFSISEFLENSVDVTDYFDDKEGEITFKSTEDGDQLWLENRRVNAGTYSTGRIFPSGYNLIFDRNTNLFIDIFYFYWVFSNNFNKKTGMISCVLFLINDEEGLLPFLVLNQSDFNPLYEIWGYPLTRYNFSDLFVPFGKVLDHLESFNINDIWMPYYVDSLYSENYFDKPSFNKDLVIERAETFSTVFVDQANKFRHMINRVEAAGYEDVEHAAKFKLWYWNAVDALDVEYNQFVVRELTSDFYKWVELDLRIPEDLLLPLFLLKAYCETHQIVYEGINQINRYPPKLVREAELDNLMQGLEHYPFLYKSLEQKQDRIMEDWNPLRKIDLCH